MSISSRTRLLRLLAHCLLLLLLTGATCSASDFHNSPSLQGFTGLLNTPNAAVTDAGKLDALYSNQREVQFANRNTREESYIFSVGLFSLFELGGRLTEAPDYGGGNLRDLSANFKIKAPFIPQGYYLPDVAFGMQDVGGGVKVLKTSYLVATEEWWRLRMSLGYGFGPDRMKGVFGGVEVKALDWLYLVGEYDTRETNAGIRLVTPYIFDIPVNINVTAKTSLDHKPGNLEFGFGLQFPLGSDHHNRTPLPVAAAETNPAPPSSHAQEADGTENRPGVVPAIGDSPSAEMSAAKKESTGQDKINRQLSKLLEKLVADGFQNVQVGSKGEELLVVEYENSRYDHNELDGLGVVVGMVVDSIPTDYKSLRLVVKKMRLRVLQLSAPLAEFRGFMHDPERYPEFNDSLRITSDVTDDGGVSFIQGDGNSSWLKSTLVVYPGLKTFVGTEVGLFSYFLSAKLDYFLNVWKGAVINARMDIPVGWSKNFDDGGAFRSSRNSSQLDRVMLFQALKPLPDVMINLGGGMVLHDAYGTINEAIWTPGNGRHRFLLKQAYISSTGNQTSQQKNEVYLGSYRYHMPSLDLYLTGTGGRFFDNDNGFSLEMKRFFGDTAFSVYFKDSWTQTREHVEAGGVMIAFPLTLRKDMKPYPLQLKGSDEWSYAQETEIVSVPGTNYVGTSIGVNPQPPFNLERVFYNRDRLSEQYIRRHLLRLRDAYLTYRQP